jgi:hypothetical protein
MGCNFKSGLACLLGIILCVLNAALPAPAETFTVINTNDNHKASSLRNAIMVANWFGGKNTIRLGRIPKKHQNNLPQTWVFHLTIPGADEDAAKTGDLDIIRGDLTIIGVTSNVVIDASGLGDRVFQVFTNAKLTLRNVTVTGGNAPGNKYGYTQDGESGGAILNAGTLFLSNCVVSGNSSGAGNYPLGNGLGSNGGNGGGICNYGTLEMEKCSVAGNLSGAGINGASGGEGGGIYNQGSLIMNDCVVSGNEAGAGGAPEGNLFGFGGSGGNGGGIYSSGLVILTNCNLCNNFAGAGLAGGQPSGTLDVSFMPGGPGGAGGAGAGIYNAGALELFFCTVSGNVAGSGGAGGNGVGLAGSAGAGGSGAGIFNGGTLGLTACTISGNLCGKGGDGGLGFSCDGAVGGGGGNGGGIYNSGPLFTISCTIVLNAAGMAGNGGDSFQSINEAASGGEGGEGGGVFNADNSVTNLLKNTLVALNVANIGGLGGSNISRPFIPVESGQVTIGDSGPDGDKPDLAGDFISQGFNLIGIGDGLAGLTNGINSDQVGSAFNPIDPMLGPLQLNGGLTPTHALLPGSPAIDQGKSFDLPTDQRGFKRPVNYPLIVDQLGGDGSDIGAFELDDE